MKRRIIVLAILALAIGVLGAFHVVTGGRGSGIRFCRKVEWGLRGTLVDATGYEQRFARSFMRELGEEIRQKSRTGTASLDADVKLEMNTFAALAACGAVDSSFWDRLNGISPTSTKH